MNISARRLLLRHSGAQISFKGKASKVSPASRPILANRRINTEIDQKHLKQTKFLIKRGSKQTERQSNSMEKLKSCTDETVKLWSNVDPSRCIPKNKVNQPSKMVKYKHRNYEQKIQQLQKLIREKQNKIANQSISNIKHKNNLRLAVDCPVQNHYKQTDKTILNQISFEISFQDTQANKYDIMEQKVLGAGTFGKVYAARNKKTGQTMAIKKVLIDRSYKCRQVQIMEVIDSKFVIKILNKFTTMQKAVDGDKQFINIVMPRYQSSFFEYLKSINYNIEPSMLKVYLYQIFRGVSDLHQKGICHRDLKPQNILIKNNKLAICDLGSAKILKKDEPNISYICSRCYRAPELIFGSTCYSVSVDMWSIGCIILEILNKSPFFLAKDSLHHLIQIMKVMGTPTKKQIMSMNPNYQIQNFQELPIVKKSPWKNIFRQCDPQLINMLEQIMLYNPQARLTADQALNHSYFQQIYTGQFLESMAGQADISHILPSKKRLSKNIRTSR